MDHERRARNEKRVDELLRVTRTITIGMTDIGEVVFPPALVERLSREAPGIALNTVRDTGIDLRHEMAEGRVDLAIGLLPQLKDGFYQRRLFDQRYVCLFRRRHALENEPLTLATWSEAEHLVVVSAGTGHGQVDDWLKQRGVYRRVRSCLQGVKSAFAIASSDSSEKKSRSCSRQSRG
jgi:DNA-binding transcriptional LysR family regulator